MILLLCVILVLVLLKLATALADTYCKVALCQHTVLLQASKQPRNSSLCKVSLIVATMVLLVVLALLWLLATVLFAASTVTADFCVEPTDDVISLFSITDNTTLYFLRCGSNPALVNPLTSDISAITSAYNDIKSAIASFNATVRSRCTPPTPPLVVHCANFTQALPVLEADVDAVFVEIGIPDASGNAQSGVLSILNCASFNGLYVSIVFLFCFFPFWLSLKR
jgi:hypothetical protein